MKNIIFNDKWIMDISGIGIIGANDNKPLSKRKSLWERLFRLTTKPDNAPRCDCGRYIDYIGNGQWGCEVCDV